MAEEKIKSATTPKTQAKPKKRKKMQYISAETGQNRLYVHGSMDYRFLAFTLFPFIFTIYLSFNNVKRQH